MNLKKSYIEKLIENELNRLGIKGWVSNFRNGTYTYDIAFPELKIDVELDGRTHSTDSGIKRDRIRDEWSVSQGWRVLRLPSKLIRSDLNEAISKINNFISNCVVR